MRRENGHLRGFGGCRLDVGKKVLWHGEKPVQLPLKAIELLALLVERDGEVVTKEEIWQRIWQNSYVEETNLTHNIYLLRKTLRDLGETNLIETVPRRGYRFAGEIQRSVAQNGNSTLESVDSAETGGGEKADETAGDSRLALPIPENPETVKTFSAVDARLRLRQFSALTILVIAALVCGGAVWYLKRVPAQVSASRGEIRSIAVLPFRTINATGENEHQGIGLADVLITRLSNIKEITVRPTSMVVDLGEQDTIEIGKNLNADAVLEGTIYHAGGKVRITARLVKTSDGASVWTGQFEKLTRDELSLQNEIALQVADALALNLSSGEKNALTKNYTENPDAFELYTKGRFEWNKRTWTKTIEAERLFRNAIELDPNFALAYVGLADASMLGSNWLEAEIAIDKALELDPDLAEAYATLGFINTFQKWNWREAEKAFNKSIELNPNYATAHHWQAQVLAIQGRTEEAKAAMRRALEINPLSHNFLADLGQIYYFNGEYGEAEKYIRRALEIYPDFEFGHIYLYQMYLKTGEYDRAVEELIAAERISMAFTNQSHKRQQEIEARMSEHRKTYLGGGIKKFMESRIGEIAAADPNVCYHYAAIFTFLGEREKALQCLEKAHAGNVFLSVFVKADPTFESLRNEPRFREILRKMNLP